jgi:hypothetical protein
LEAELRAAKRALKRERAKRARVPSVFSRKSSVRGRGPSGAGAKREERKPSAVKSRRPKVGIAPPQVARVRGAKPRSLEAKLLRDEKGKFITPREKRKLEGIKKLLKEEEKGKRAEERLRALKYPVTKDVFRRLSGAVKKATRAAEDTNLDLVAEMGMTAYRNIFDAKVSIGGLPEIDMMEMGERLNKEHVVEEAILAALTAMFKSRVKRGLQVQLQLLPTETVLMKYGRTENIMSTMWLDIDDESKLGSLAMRGRLLLKALAKNDWDVTRVNLNFHYDREVAAS